MGKLKTNKKPLLPTNAVTPPVQKSTPRARRPIDTQSNETKTPNPDGVSQEMNQREIDAKFRKIADRLLKQHARTWEELAKY